MSICALCKNKSDKETGHDKCFAERDIRIRLNQCIACKKQLSKAHGCDCSGEYKGYIS